MSRFTRIQVALKIEEEGVMPLFYHSDLEVCKNIVKACYEGGIRVMEYTNRGDFAHEVYSALNAYTIKEFPDMVLGVGTVMDAGTASLYIQAGANFILSPVLHEDVAKVCNRRKILWVPGCATVTEISKAEELGAELVKIFPAALLGGPKFISSVKGPMPWTSIIVTGGVEPNEDNLKGWFAAGATAVGMSQMIKPEDITSGNYHQITQRCKEVLEIAKKVRK